MRGGAALLFLGLLLAFPAAAEKIRLGVMAGAEEEIAEIAAKVAKSHGIDLQLIVFQDYQLPDAALDEGELDANAFQHRAYLDAQIEAHGYHLVPIGQTALEPMAVYSRTLKKIADIPAGARIGIPNDPSNGGRALKLLASAGLITVRDRGGHLPSLFDIADNPKKLRIIELDAAQLPHALDDFAAAVINTNHALESGLDPAKDALLSEPSSGNPYAMLLVVREKDRDKPVFKSLLASFQSKEVAAFLETSFKGVVLPAW
jgi:D-methionine transport system substrate-binding protein